MINAKNFFFFSESNIADVLCDFRRMDDRMILKFCKAEDTKADDVLTITIRSTLVETANTSYRDHFVSYELDSFGAGIIKQGESDPIPGDLVWGVVIAIVNDAFQA